VRLIYILLVLALILPPVSEGAFIYYGEHYGGTTYQSSGFTDIGFIDGYDKTVYPWKDTITYLQPNATYRWYKNTNPKYVVPPSPNGCLYSVINGYTGPVDNQYQEGTTGTTDIAWPTTEGSQILWGTIQFVCKYNLRTGKYATSNKDMNCIPYDTAIKFAKSIGAFDYLVGLGFSCVSNGGIPIQQPPNVIFPSDATDNVSKVPIAGNFVIPNDPPIVRQTLSTVALKSSMEYDTNGYISSYYNTTYEIDVSIGPTDGSPSHTSALMTGILAKLKTQNPDWNAWDVRTAVRTYGSHYGQGWQTPYTLDNINGATCTDPTNRRTTSVAWNQTVDYTLWCKYTVAGYGFINYLNTPLFSVYNGNYDKMNLPLQPALNGGSANVLNTDRSTKSISFTYAAYAQSRQAGSVLVRFPFNPTPYLNQTPPKDLWGGTVVYTDYSSTVGSTFVMTDFTGMGVVPNWFAWFSIDANGNYSRLEKVSIEGPYTISWFCRVK
jgi:hypothetical protein